MRVYEELRRQGWDADKWDGKERADIIVVQYNMRALEEALAAAPVVVYDCNDMTFADAWPGPKETIIAGMARVSAIVAGSPRLGQHLERLHPTVRMIEQAVGPQYWSVKPRKHEGLHLFWMGMHDNITYFRDLDPVLEALAKRHEFTVHFCTSRKSNLDHGDGCVKSNEKRVATKPYPTEFHEWSVEGALEVMATCDLGIAPLFQNEWCWCKCANKAVNMMAAGLAVVVSDVPSYRAAIEDGVTGRLCYGPEEWEVALDELMGNATKRKDMGKAGKKAAGAYRLDVIAGQWADFLTEVA